MSPRWVGCPKFKKYSFVFVVIKQTKRRNMKPWTGSITNVAPKKSDLSILRKENRQLRSCCKEIKASRSNWKSKYLLLKSSLAVVQNTITNHYECETCQQSIKRHKYNEQLVGLCVNIYVTGGCGLRGVVNILKYLNVALAWGLEDIPCKSSVENWVIKAGYYIYDKVDTCKYEKGYAVVMDECMVQGQERMLAVLGVPANKQTNDALGLNDVDVLGLRVRPSWDSCSIAKVLEEITQKIGEKPTYIISDGSSNLKSAITQYESFRICDAGHEIARLLEHVYKKEPDFENFMKACVQCKYKEVMKPTCYLNPPKQRVIARFMNLSHTIKWAEKLLKIQHNLPETERRAFSFIKNHKAIIHELNSAFEMINEMLHVLKHQGLSFKTVEKCLEECQNYLLNAPYLLSKLIVKVKEYLQTEKEKLFNKDTVWHTSSDIIESMFGMFKNRKASNPLHGVTPFALYLPLLTKTNIGKTGINCNLKDALEGVLISDLKSWNKKYLIENQVVKRCKMFNNKN
jgi:transposase-like protein